MKLSFRAGLDNQKFRKIYFIQDSIASGENLVFQLEEAPADKLSDTSQDHSFSRLPSSATKTYLPLLSTTSGA